MSRWDRVRESLPQSVSSRIDRETEGRIDFVIQEGPGAILHRIEQLDREWDVDRALMANFAIAGGVTLAAGLLRNRRFLIFSGVQLFFLLYHSIKGWCPPASLLRRMGFRTQKEILAERQVLHEALERESEGFEGMRRAA